VSSDERRIDGLFQQHHHGLWRFALRMTGDAELARDLTQDTFLRALTRRVPEGARQAEAWLMQTLVNLCRDAHRRRSVRRVHRDRARVATQPRPAADPESAAAAHGKVDAAIAALSSRRRAVLVLHELDGRNVEDVAQLLGLRVATVRWHLARARKELRKRLAVEPAAAGRQR